VLERRAAVETETGNAQDSELHRQHITLLAAWIVTGRIVNSGYFTVRKGGGIEARRLKRVLVEPEADRVLWLHVSILLVLGEGERQRSPGRPRFTGALIHVMICYIRRCRLFAFVIPGLVPGASGSWLCSRWWIKLQEGGCGVAGTFSDFAGIRSLGDAEQQADHQIAPE